jgi:putative protease
VVRYAHTYGVQVLVTLNTLLRKDEYPEAVALAHALYKIGVDALIVQDLHLLDFPLPPIRLHASTQCDNRTAEQVARLRDMGFRRAVLARELSIQEIRAIHEAVPDIELEAFVHGALCVSYSGRCYISEVLAGRSANRGACAQFCRMAYDVLDESMNEVLDAEGRPIHQRYVLSLQDLDRSAHLQELIDAGVTTFKIEGRLKDADYVTNVVAYYREKLQAFSIQQSAIPSRRIRRRLSIAAPPTISCTAAPVRWLTGIHPNRRVNISARYWKPVAIPCGCGWRRASGSIMATD